MSEEIENLKKKILHPNAVALDIRRVPKDTVEVFKQFANEHFVGDYGMTLKKLVDVVLIEPLPFQQIYGILEDHERRIAKLENTEPKKLRVIKTISGREIKVPIKDEENRRGKE